VRLDRSDRELLVDEVLQRWKGGLLLLGDPWHEPIPVQQFQIRVKRISPAAEISLVLSSFRKDQMQKPEFSGCITLTCVRANATRKLRPDKPYFDHHVLNAIYLHTGPCTGLVIHRYFRLQGLKHPSTGYAKAGWMGNWSP
jgi:hypothetical protein